MGVYFMGGHLMGGHLKGVYHMGGYLIRVHLVGVHHMGVYLISEHLMGVYHISGHLMGVYLMDGHFIGVHFYRYRCISYGRACYGRTGHLISAYLMGVQLISVGLHLMRIPYRHTAYGRVAHRRVHVGFLIFPNLKTYLGKVPYIPPYLFHRGPFLSVLTSIFCPYLPLSFFPHPHLPVLSSATYFGSFDLWPPNRFLVIYPPGYGSRYLGSEDWYCALIHCFVLITCRRNDYNFEDYYSLLSHC
jgi:hypothetical protein